MTVDDIARIFPHIAEAQREPAAALYTASETLQAEIAKAPLRDDMRKMTQQQVAQAVFTAVNLLGQG